MLDAPPVRCGAIIGEPVASDVLFHLLHPVRLVAQLGGLYEIELTDGRILRLVSALIRALSSTKA